MSGRSVDVLVIGAGWAGLSAAQSLGSSGWQTWVVEKGRGPGGRCATRREGIWSFDHGAQYFTAYSDEFIEALREWEALGLVGLWTPRLKVFGQRPDEQQLNRPKSPSRWVGIPGNNAVLQHLASDTNVSYQHRVTHLRRRPSGWEVEIESPEGLLVCEATRIVLTAPPAQSGTLVGAGHPLFQTLEHHHMAPAWAVLVAFEQPLEVSFDAAFVNEGPLSWFCRQGSKVGRKGEAWVLHASAAWSEQYLELSFEEASQRLYEAWQRLIGSLDFNPSHLVAHRWRYAQSLEPLTEGCLFDQDSQLVIAGDWCSGNRVEGAWLSGQRAAKALTIG